MFALAQITAYAQGCNCPPVETCVCDGGLIKLTLRYNGTEEIFIEVVDEENVVGIGGILPDQEFEIVNLLGPDPLFRGNMITLRVDWDDSRKIEINTSCGNSLRIGDEFGAEFTVVGGLSLNGGAICCREVDGTPPVIIGCPGDVTAFADKTCGTAVLWKVPGVQNSCTISLTSSHHPGEIFPVGTTAVVYTARDAAGNSSTCSFNVNVVDNTPPVFTSCPPDIIVSADMPCHGTASWLAPIVTDNCTFLLTTDHDPGHAFPVGTTVVTYTARDQSNNASTCSFNVTVLDDAAPQIVNCPETISVALAFNECNALVTWTPPGATGSCSPVISSNYRPGDIFPVGTTTVTYTVRNNVGAVSSCSFDVIVEDRMIPEFAACPEDIVVTTDASGCGAAVRWTPPAVSDNCTTLPVLTATHSPGDFFAAGTTTTVLYSATDAAGNAAQCTFTVTVKDEIEPVFQRCPEDLSIAATDGCSAIATWTPPDVTDNCSISVVTSSYQPGTRFETGTTEVVYTATDVHGNVAMCRFTITVRNETQPVLDRCPGDIEVWTGEENEATATWTLPTAFTSCGQLSMNSNYVPGAVFPLGITEVSYTATNDAGIAVSCRFNVLVKHRAPDIDVARVVTPDGDGINDVWILSNIENFARNKVVIVDRWGSVVYQVSGYNNSNIVWNGTTPGGSSAPAGTYFYFLEVDFREQNVKKSGSIELLR
jgi:gliding motility-associated-like protein